MNPWHRHISAWYSNSRQKDLQEKAHLPIIFPVLTYSVPYRQHNFNWDEQRTIQIGKKWEGDHSEIVHFPTYVLIYIIVFL